MFVLALDALLRVGSAHAVGNASCSTISVSVDTSLATNVGEIILGMAWGQTFVATDTLIESVTVWRIPPEHNDSTETKFWITEVDGTGKPHTHLVTYDGPWLTVVTPDSTHVTPITYIFDPPISLPRPSTYCFWIQVCVGYADLLIATGDHYPGGQLWQTFRSDFDGCILRDYPQTFVGADLAFTLNFCHQNTTGTRRSSWGQLKTLYR